ncbi:MAG: hypothetical protein M3238_01745, partial [Actinomycetota bacterium]|nr:hypothetical protein [Actinomycetota bacterium]
ALLRDSLVRLVEGSHRFAIADALDVFTEVALADGDATRAARLLGASEEARRAIGTQPLAIVQPRWKRSLQAAQDALGPEEFERAWNEGMKMSLDEIVEYAVSTGAEKVRA